MYFLMQKKENYGVLKGIIIACHHIPTWWVTCDFSHVYSLWISWWGMQLFFIRWSLLKLLRYEIRQNYLSFWANFCPMPWQPKKSKFWKKIKKPGDIILYLCTTNEGHMMHGCWDIQHGRQNFLTFWAILSHFTP